MKRAGRLGAVAAMWVAAVAAGSAATITLTPSADTTLFELLPDFNFGAQEDLPAGTLGGAADFKRSRLLLKFDLAASLPAHALIQSARLRLTVTRVPDGGGANSIFSLHRVLRGWGEGRQQGPPPGGAKASEGEASWNFRRFPDEPWGAPGGQPGLDFAAVPGSSERILQPGSYDFEFGANQIAELQAWLQAPETNFGWMLLSQAEAEPKTARRFAAREHPGAESRPALILEYTLAPPLTPPRITALRLVDGTAEIRFAAQAGITYTLLARASAATGPWEPAAAPRLADADGELTLVDDSGLAAQRFYRLLAGR